MEKAKELRRITRQRFTKCVSKVNDILSEKCKDALQPEFERLTKLFEELSVVQNKLIELWLDDTQRDESLFEKDIEASDAYETTWFDTKYRVNEFLNMHGSQSSYKGTVKGKDENDSESSMDRRRHFRLPKLKLPTFNGEVKNWIGFWSQFNKIHQDDEIDNDDKFQYLLQCMEDGSCAKELVESFPPCGENYHKVVQQIKERFAKDELIIEYYVRELLQLVLAQSKGTQKITLRALYDKLMTQILALDSLGVTQEKYAAFLFPLVESALPEDILKAWNRSQSLISQDGNALTKLITFLKLEVESDEKIRLARSAFSESYSAADPTAACFTTTNKKNNKDKQQVRGEKIEKQCLWCDKTSHSSSECHVAINKTLQERKDFIKHKKACFICLTIGHMWNRCRKHPKCVVCGRRRYPIMCGGLPENIKSELASTELDPQEVVLNHSSSSKTVLLQTLKVNIEHGGKIETIRVLLDSGAQRSFIRSEVVEKLGLEPVNEEQLSHTLFGGAVTKKIKHRLFNLQLKSIFGSYSCKLKALEQGTICGVLPKLNKGGTFISLLKSKGVDCITDCIDNSVAIDLLIGCDVLGSILTGRSVRIDDHVLALETRLGWTVQGPAVGTHCSVNNVSALHSTTSSIKNVEYIPKSQTHLYSKHRRALYSSSSATVGRILHFSDSASSATEPKPYNSKKQVTSSGRLVKIRERLTL